MEERVDQAYLSQIEPYIQRLRSRIELGYINGNVCPWKNNKEGIIGRLVKKLFNEEK